jgi:hypothetical protein
MHDVARALHCRLHQVPITVLHHKLEGGCGVDDGTAARHRPVEAALAQEVCLKQDQARDVGCVVLQLPWGCQGPAARKYHAITKGPGTNMCTVTPPPAPPPPHYAGSFHMNPSRHSAGRAGKGFAMEP